MNIKSEVDARIALDAAAAVSWVIGKGHGSKRVCPFCGKGDDAALSFDKRTGAWKCHRCDEKGDVYSLIMKVKKITFVQALHALARHYDIIIPPPNPMSRGAVTQELYSAITTAPQSWRMHREQIEEIGLPHLMHKRYGIRPVTLAQYSLFWSFRLGRLMIPVVFNGDVVNLRGHDVLRKHATWVEDSTGKESRSKPSHVTVESVIRQAYNGWTPKYNKKRGKVTSLDGSSNWLYLGEQAAKSSDEWVYVVGGELKALVLAQSGIAACSFTHGEGSWDEEAIRLLAGRKVRVLFDADPEKFGTKLEGKASDATQRVALAFANAGCYVQAGIWPDELIKTMPRGGDITDVLMRTAWDAQADDLDDALVRETLTFFKWRHVERDVALETQERKIRVHPEGVEQLNLLSTAPEIPFAALGDPKYIHKTVAFAATTIGVGSKPYVVPATCKMICRPGEATGGSEAKCGRCRLARNGFRQELDISEAGRLEFVGMTANMMSTALRQAAGIPKGCYDASMEVAYSNLDVSFFSPTIEDTGRPGSATFGVREMYVVDSNRFKMTDAGTVRVTATLMPDPRSRTLSGIVHQVTPVVDDVFKFTRDPEMEEHLRDIFSGLRVEQAMDLIIGQVRDFVVRDILGQDDMLRAIMLAWMMPFGFRLGDQTCERISPQIAVLGATTTGKSTAFTRMVEYFGCGEVIKGDSRPTFAGLIGGTTQAGDSRNAFSWGRLPMNNRRLVGFDEFGQLPLEIWDSMTATFTSGIAERNTADFKMQRECKVRLCTLANPRGERKLESYANPLEAAIKLYGTEQALGRVDLMHIQYSKKDTRAFAVVRAQSREQLITRDVMRYLISWAWSRKETDYLFQDPAFVARLAIDTSNKVGQHNLFLPAQARWKLGKIAIAVATWIASINPEGKVYVSNEIARYAAQIVEDSISAYTKPFKGDIEFDIPPEVLQVFDAVPDNRVRRLNMLVTAPRVTMDDINAIFGEHARSAYEALQYDAGWLNRRGDSYTLTRMKEQRALIEGYVSARLIKIEAAIRRGDTNV
jgi:hypothetical protein